MAKFKRIENSKFIVFVRNFDYTIHVVYFNLLKGIIMEKRHQDLLTSRLEQIVTTGSTYIAWSELYLWYGVQKLAKRTYRDLSERWDEIATTYGLTELGKLSFVQSPWTKGGGGAGIHLFGSDMPQLVDDYDD
jgi:hypothetical protein